MARRGPLAENRDVNLHNNVSKATDWGNKAVVYSHWTLNVTQLLSDSKILTSLEAWVTYENFPYWDKIKCDC